jgi:hypothetical protein
MGWDHMFSEANAERFGFPYLHSGPIRFWVSVAVCPLDGRLGHFPIPSGPDEGWGVSRHLYHAYGWVFFLFFLVQNPFGTDDDDGWGGWTTYTIRSG